MEYGLGRTVYMLMRLNPEIVLILVLMEYGLGLRELVNKARRAARVLILVLMEYGLGQSNPHQARRRR